MMRMSLLPLLVHDDDVRRRVTGFLGVDEAVRLAVVALDADFRGLVLWLLHGDAPLPPLHWRELLNEAARLGCWAAARKILREIECAGIAGAPKSRSARSEVVQQLHTVDVCPGLIEALIRAGVVFPFNVIQAAATRGDLSNMQWLVYFVQPPQHSTRGGSRLRHPLHVVDWLAHSSPKITCLLPLDDELEAVCWRAQNNGLTQYYTASARHGYAYGGYVGLNKDDESTRIQLGSLFAGEGNAETLSKVYKRPNARKLISQDAIHAAAAGGHLHVVQWLYERFPEFLSPSCLAAAAKNGHLHVLKWLDQFHLRIGGRCVVETARSGHVECMRWLRSRHPPTWDSVYEEALLCAAGSGRLRMVQFLLEECNAEFALTDLPWLRRHSYSDIVVSVLKWLSGCTCLGTFAYILDRANASQEQLEMLLDSAAVRGSLKVVQYLVSGRGIWSPTAFKSATRRSNTRAKTHHELTIANTESLAICRFFIDHARTQATNLGTTLEAQVCLDKISILQVAHKKNYLTAQWLAQYSRGGLRSHGSDEFRSVRTGGYVCCRCGQFGSYVPDVQAGAVSLCVVVASVVDRDWFFGSLRVARCHGPSETAVCRPRTCSHRVFPGDILHGDSSHSARQNSDPMQKNCGMGCVVQPLPGAAAGCHSSTTSHARAALAVRRDASCRTQPRGYSPVGTRDMRMICVAESVSDAAFFCSVVQTSARFGHEGVLKWAFDHAVLSPQDTNPVSFVFQEAARYHHVHCLRWLMVNVDVPTGAVAKTMVDAVQEDSVAVVNLLTRAYSPDELCMRRVHASLVRRFLVKHGMIPPTRSNPFRRFGAKSDINGTHSKQA